MRRGVFKLRPAEFWSNPTRTFDETVDEFLASGEAGIFLDAPQQVDCGHQAELPFLLMQSLPASIMTVCPLESTAILAVCRLESNEHWVERAFDWKQELVDEDEGFDDEELPYDGNTVQAFAFELRERVPALPWRAGTLALRLIHLDCPSESVEVRMVQTPHGPVDKEVEAFVVANRGRGYPKAVFPAHDSEGLLGYRLYPYLPAPEEAGVTISVDSPEVKLSDESWNLRGAFRLPLLPREVVREAEGGEGDRLAQLGGAGWEDVGDEHAVGVIPVTLLMTGPDCLDPGVITLQVPVYSTQQGADLSGELVEGHFNLNLRKMEGVPLHAERLYLYAMSGAYMSSACALTVVGE